MKRKNSSRKKHRLNESAAKNPYTILVTATMSAGKSSIVNALVGKEICRAENMACTDKIHVITGTKNETGCIIHQGRKFAAEVTLDVLNKAEAPNDNGYITTSLYFYGVLQGMMIALKDSPGINSSMDISHKLITEREIKTGRYDLLLYVMNATQLGTEDDNRYLDFIKENVDSQKIIFVLNKIDQIDPDKEYIEKIMDDVRQYIHSKGFNHPILCPVSATNGFLGKKSYNAKLGKLETMQLNFAVQRMREISLWTYYENAFPNVKICDRKDYEYLLSLSGIEHLEKIIFDFYRGVMKK